MFCTAVNPVDDDQSMEEVQYGLDKPRIAPYRNTWRPHQNTMYWCNLKLAQKKGLQFYQTRSHAIVLYNTPAICIEKAVCIKTKDELSHRIHQVPRVPRVRLKPNSQSGQQDQPDQDPRKSSDHQSVSGSYGETRSGNVDYRIPGIPHTTVQQEDTNRRETVKKLIQQFENHPDKEFFLLDLNKTEEIKYVQRKVEENDHRHGQYRDLRALRNLLQETMPLIVLFFFWRDWHCAAHVEEV